MSSALRDYVDGWLAGTAPVPPVVSLIGIRLLGYTAGEGRAELDAEPRHHNAMGTVHGGILCDLADVAIGAAVVSTLSHAETFTTLSLQIDYLRPVVEGRLIATARVIKRGSAAIFCDCEIADARGQQIARIRSTSLLRQERT